MQNPPAGPEDLTKAPASDAQRRRAAEALSYLIFSTGLVCRRYLIDVCKYPVV